MGEAAAIVERLRALSPSRPVVLWGAGRAGVLGVRFLRDHGIEPSAFVDSSVGDGHAPVEGLPVLPPARLMALGETDSRPYVVVTSQYADDIVATAAGLGLTAPDAVCVLRTPADAFPGVVDPLAPDFYALLHELRGQVLADMPAGVETMLSAGCSGRWYFDWVAATYGPVGRHIGAEAFLPEPADLPPNVQWLARDVSSVPEVRDGSVDLVFSGQNVEHLWPAQVEAFLLESHRVLRREGWLVVDSPNRDLTAPLNWSHPEHTVEYTVDEIREILDLAGFGEVRIKGVWLCRDDTGLLPLSPFGAGSLDAMRILRRAALARDRPDQAFLWWAEARKQRPPRAAALRTALERVFAAAWPERLNRFVVATTIDRDAQGAWAAVPAGSTMLVAEGPLFPLPAGRHRIRVGLRPAPGARSTSVRLVVTQGEGTRERPVATATSDASSPDAVVETHVEVPAMTFGFRVRLSGNGSGAGQVRLSVDLRTEG